MFILQTLQENPVEWVSKSELKATCDLADTTFYGNLNILINKGYVEQRGSTAKQLRYIPDQDRLV